MVDSSLLFPSLEIKNFRTFRHLTVSQLGRVNLIVGKNNVGKSSLLEALLLYANEGALQTIWTLARLRRPNEPVNRRIPSPEEYNVTAVFSALSRLYYGRLILDDLQEVPSISIGAKNDAEKQLQLTLPLYYKRNVSSEEGADNSLLKVQYQRDYYKREQEYPLRSFQSNISNWFWALDSSLELQNRVNSVFIPSHGLSQPDAAALYDKIATMQLEREMIQSLRLVEPDTQDVRYVVTDDSIYKERQAIIRLVDNDYPIPLMDMGEGMQRLLSISLALANSKEGLLLVDEIENGLHYSVLIKMWRIIFETANRLNVQVFATTHSDDCIRAFQNAAVEAQETEGMLISLRRKEKSPEEVFAVTSDEEELTSVMHADIEVR